MSRAVLTALGAVLVASGCRGPERPSAAASTDPNQVIATYSGGQFTRGEIEPILDRRLQGRRAANDAERGAALRSVLERRMRIRLLYAEAVEAGLPERPAVKAVLAALERRALAADWLRNHAEKDAAATPAQVEAELQRRQAAQQPEELRRFSHIFLRAAQGDEAARARARATLALIQKALAEGRSFEELARKYSDSITARGGGHVDWTSKGPLHDKLADVIFGLSEGQLGEPIETETGLHLVRLDGIRRPPPADPQGLRAQLQAALDAEAKRAAVAAARARAFDASGVIVDAARLARPGPKDEVLATFAGQKLTRQELGWLQAGLRPETPLADLLKQLVEEALLAEQRRAEAQDAALEQRLSEARLGYLVELRREELVRGLATDVTPQEERGYYVQNQDREPTLRDHLIDLLFFAQAGPSPAQVYAQGEDVSRRLRSGETFDAVLTSLAAKPGALVRRGLSAGDLVTLRAQSARLAQELGRMAPGEVSTPLYMDGENVKFREQTAVLQGKGVLFVRVQSTRPLPFEAVRERIRGVLRQQKEAAGVADIQTRLNERGNLKILVSSL